MKAVTPRCQKMLSALEEIEQAGIPITSRELAQRARITPNMASQWLARLEARGFIREVRRGWGGHCATYARTNQREVAA